MIPLWCGSKMLKDTFYKTVGTFGVITGKKLKLIFDRSGTSSTNGTEIKIVCSENPTIWDYATLKHELAHILSKSSFVLMQRFIQENKQFPLLAKMIFNVLEDKRSDWFWISIYRGYESEVAEMAESMIDNTIQKGLINSLIVVRYNRSDLVAQAWRAFIPDMEKAFNMVTGTTPEGTYRIAVWLWAKLITQIRNQVRQVQKKAKSQQEKQEQQQGQPKDGDAGYKQKEEVSNIVDPTMEPDDKGQGRGVLDSVEDKPKKDDNGNLGNKEEKKDSQDSKDSKDKSNNGNGYPDNWSINDEIDTLEELERQLKEDDTKLADMDQANNQASKWEDNHDDRYGDPRTLDPTEDLDKALQESRRRAKEEINKIKDKLFIPVPEDRDPVKMVDGIVTKYDLHIHKKSCSDSIISAKLKKYLKRVHGRTKQIYNDSGDSVDIDKYIQWKIHPEDNREFFIEHKNRKAGFAITILVDCSSSMNTDKKITHAKATTATLMEALESIPGVDLTVVGWSGRRKNSNITLQVAKKHQQVNSMGGYGNTPTHLALRWATEDMKLKNARKRLIIMLTDGLPQCSNDKGQLIPTETVCQYGHKAVQDARRVGIQYYGILISNKKSTMVDEIMQKIFGHKSYDVLPPIEGLQRLGDVVIRNLVHELQKR